MIGQETITPWAQFGLAGLVIGALLAFLWKKDEHVYALKKSMDELTDAVRDLIDFMRDKKD